MLAYFDQGQQLEALEMGRQHPWSVTVNTPDGRYIDFKAHPELIEETLEDIPRAAGPRARERIVQFLRWANGPESPFETNDFGLRPIKTNESRISPKALEQIGRLTIFRRDLNTNTPAWRLEQLGLNLEARLKQNEPSFRDACWGWCLWPHWFTALGPPSEDSEGAVLQLMLWSWGDDDAEIESSFVKAFDLLQVSLVETHALMNHREP